MDAIEKLRRDILRDYATSIGLADKATYISGAPLRPVVPLDVGSKVFIIGAYPSARFGVMGGERDVPMADNLGPFEPEDRSARSKASSCSSGRRSAQFRAVAPHHLP